jgi:hypothetical protein
MAKTTTAVLTQEQLDMISAEMLIQPDDVYLFFQNGPIQRADQEIVTPGAKTINFNRPVLPTGTYTEASRRLTDGTVIDLTGIAIAETQVTLTTREYGGPHDGVAVRPFIVTEFLKNRAKHNVVALIGEFLRRDRNRFVDTATMNLLLAATTIVTPDGSAQGAIAAGMPASVDWLRRMNKQMKDSKIPPFANGRWRIILSTQDEFNLKKDPDVKQAFQFAAQQNPIFQGYIATLEQFDIMVSTMLSTTGVGAGGGVPGYQSTAFGPYGLGWGIGLAPSVRQADDTDFGRQESVIWKSEEALGTLYSDLIVLGITT